MLCWCRYDTSDANTSLYELFDRAENMSKWKTQENELNKVMEWPNCRGALRTWCNCNATINQFKCSTTSYTGVDVMHIADKFSLPYWQQGNKFTNATFQQTSAPTVKWKRSNTWQATIFLVNSPSIDNWQIYLPAVMPPRKKKKFGSNPNGGNKKRLT